MRLFDQRAGDDGAVLQHVLEIDEVAVVHVLGEIVGIMEMDDAGVVRLNDLARQQHSGSEILRHLACHIVALDGVDGGVLVGVLLLDLLVVRLDQRQDLVVGGVGLAHERAGVAVGDILLGDLVCPVRHDLMLDQILDLLDRHGVTRVLACLGDVLCRVNHLAVG